MGKTEADAAEDIGYADAREELAQPPDGAEIAEAHVMAVVLAPLPDAIVEAGVSEIIRVQPHRRLGMLLGGDPIAHAEIGHGGKIVPLRVPLLKGHRVQERDGLVELPGVVIALGGLQDRIPKQYTN